MMKVSVHDFQREVDCIYDGEKYSVRDNGAVFRHQTDGKRARPNDNQWTFGKKNSANPYLHISGVRVHRIVATAFHGEPPEPTYVVDHFDSNCRNNRPENLRWLTRLENSLKNPLTRKKIEYLCGSIEAFLDNPSILNDVRGDPNFKWMRRVTPEEASNCKVRMSVWANSDTKPKRSAGEIHRNSSIGEEVYQPVQKWEVGLAREPGLELALTPWCAQYMWGPAYFPSCPQDFGIDPLDDYFEKLIVGAVLAYCDHQDFSYKLKVLETVVLKYKASILVLCKETDSQWTIIGISFDEKSRHFIHFILGTFASKSEADKEFRVKMEDSDFWSDGYNNAYNSIIS